MNVNSSSDVLELFITRREKEHHSRNRLAYHVYLSYYFFDYNSKKNSSSSSSSSSDDSSTTSTSSSVSIISVVVPSFVIMQQAARRWNSFDVNIKRAWKQRAEFLNAQPRVDGLFESLPLSIEENNLKSYVLANLTSDWRHLVKLFKSMITKRRSTILDRRNSTYTFGNEKIRIGTQVLCYFYVSPLLMFAIFGNSPLFSSFHDYEIKYDKKNLIIAHIYSHRRLLDLFTYAGLSAVSFLHPNQKSTLKYIACGKASLKSRDGKHIIGYIVNEMNDELEIKLHEFIDNATGEDKIIKVKRPLYVRDQGKYIYEEIGQQEEEGTVGQIETFSLYQIWPTRIKINRHTGASCILCSIHTYDDESPQEFVHDIVAVD